MVPRSSSIWYFRVLIFGIANTNNAVFGPDQAVICHLSRTFVHRLPLYRFGLRKETESQNVLLILILHYYQVPGINVIRKYVHVQLYRAQATKYGTKTYLWVNRKQHQSPYTVIPGTWYTLSICDTHHTYVLHHYNSSSAVRIQEILIVRYHGGVLMYLRPATILCTSTYTG